ncbi:hypothetical protein HUJ05_001783 [Dendroctonus ponderosae]|nr:hypothetical protein HUJ05_001783 [Dendroctonus ponderosae]
MNIDSSNERSRIGCAPLLAISQLIRDEVADWYSTISPHKGNATVTWQKLKELTPTKGEESGSRKIVDGNSCSGSRNRGTSIGHNRNRVFQGHSEHNN